MEKIRIFVFGSNLAGRHGKGAALYARQHHGARYGQGYGLQGNSFAIPTKGHNLEVLDIDTIKMFIRQFINFARKHPDMEFDVTPVGCGYAGYSRKEIRPLFYNSPANVHFTKEWNEDE